MSYKDQIIEVPGENQGKVFLFTLSTCVWCKKTKALLKELGVSHSYIDTDLVQGSSKHDLMADFKKFSSEISFPTIVIDDGKEIIVGFDEDKIRQRFANG